MDVAETGDMPVTVIQPSRGWLSLPLREWWQYRELLYFFVWRDVKVRYKQTFLGAAWAVLKPFATMVLFSIIFGRLAKLPSDGIPYPIFAYTALLPWELFAHSLSSSTNSMVGSRGLITKLYFPRMFIPMGSILAGLVDFTIAFVLLIGMMFYFDIRPTVALFTLPLFLAFAVATALSIGLWLAVLNVRFRDVRYTLPFLTSFWLWATPVAYSTSLIPEKWRIIYGLNPMAGVVEGFRWAMLGKEGGLGPLVLVSVLVVAVLLSGGLMYFHRMEKTFADLV